MQKHEADRKRRLKYYEAAIDLIQNSTIAPVSKPNPNRSKETLHRFYGVTADGDCFAVQIREDIRTNTKYLYSIFPLPK